MVPLTTFSFFRYKGTYCSQEVAIKVLKPDSVNIDVLKEFSQEVFIMRFVKFYDLAVSAPAWVWMLCNLLLVSELSI